MSGVAPLLTPAQVLALFGYKDRHSLAALVARGKVERVNVGGDTPQGTRWRYRLKPLDPQPPEPDLEELHWGRIKRGHGL